MQLVEELEVLVENAAKEMGYTVLRDKQREAVLGFLRRRDVFLTSTKAYKAGLDEACCAALTRVFR